MRNYFKDFSYAVRATCFRNFGFPFTGPSRLQIAATYLCNSKCKMCSIWKIYQNNRQKNVLKKEFTLSEFKRIIDNYPDFKDIWITGGEPLLKKDIVKIIKYIDKNTSAWFSFQTNAILLGKIKRQISQILKKVNHNFGLGISIDGFEKTHDFQRGIKGNWKNAMDLLDWSMKKAKKHSNFHPTTTFTMTKWNVDEFPKYVDFLVDDKKINPSQIVFGIAGISDTYYHNSENYSPHKKKAIKSIQKIQKKYKEFRNYYVDGMIEYLKKPFKMKCYAGISFNYVDPYLNVYPCIYFEEPIGNLRDFDYDIIKLWKSEKAKEMRKRIKKLDCPDCPWNGCVVSPNISSNPVLGIKKFIKKNL